MVLQSYKAITEAAKKESHAASRSSKALADTSRGTSHEGPVLTKTEERSISSILLPSAETESQAWCVRVRAYRCEMLLPKTASVGEAWEPPPMLVSFLFLFFLSNPDNFMPVRSNISQLL